MAIPKSSTLEKILFYRKISSKIFTMPLFPIQMMLEGSRRNYYIEDLKIHSFSFEEIETIIHIRVQLQEKIGGMSQIYFSLFLSSSFFNFKVGGEGVISYEWLVKPNFHKVRLVCEY